MFLNFGSLIKELSPGITTRSSQCLSASAELAKRICISSLGNETKKNDQMTVSALATIRNGQEGGQQNYNFSCQEEEDSRKLVVLSD
eukprot:5095077-Ditylum_brightwellii.AAC.1